MATSAPAHRPGYCADHPAQRLVTHESFGLRWYGRRIAVVCPHPDHEPQPGTPPHLRAERERCRWCGGPRIRDGEVPWKVSDRREYCRDLCRLQAFRARQRAER